MEVSCRLTVNQLYKINMKCAHDVVSHVRYINSLGRSDAVLVTGIWINIGSGNGVLSLLPGVMKPSTETM